MRIVAVTACPTGIAHTYMAADKLINAAKQFKVAIKVETQGAMGVENRLSRQDIDAAELVILAADIRIEQPERFEGKPCLQVSISEALNQTEQLLLSTMNGRTPQ
ncbi:PTS fructose transporter subunit IIB [Aliagarivorans taiwanensis]|uniref:PTS fructose transporter subunit IIB n=1 Tax=Aliagarivorans taiwanensis TaxID=561966 RepID=UPI000479338B|nr:PTS fructose transporter subunit IIB [Aliagarivorans taiwanensis]